MLYGATSPQRTGWEQPTQAASRRPPSLTPESVQHRYDTLIDALRTADRRQRGHLPYEKVMEIYSLFFHTSFGELRDADLGSFVEKHAFHAGAQADLVVDYERLADALRKRDLDMMTKAEARALRQTGPYGSPEKGAAVETTVPYRCATRNSGAGVYAALHMQIAEEPRPAPAPAPPLLAFGRLSRGTRPAPLTDVAYGGAATSNSPSKHASPVGPAHQRGGWSGDASPIGGTPKLEGGHHMTGAGDSGEAAFGHDGMGVATTTAIGAAAAGSLMQLLQVAEAADADGSGRLYGSQLMTCCRLEGIEESSSLLQAMIGDCLDTDGRVDYVKFVQQLAAQRAGHSARSSFDQARRALGSG